MESTESASWRRNPNDVANPISRLFLLWTIPMFRAGYTKIMEISDLFGPKKSDRSEVVGDSLERYWNCQMQKCDEMASRKKITDPMKKPRPSLIKCLLYTFKWEFMWVGFITLMNECVFRLFQPILLGRLLSFFKVSPAITREDALITAGLIVLLNFVSSVAMNHYTLSSYHMGMRARIAVCSLIYRKSLKLSRTALADSTPGKAVNLLSNDVNRFDIAAFFLHYMWVSPLAALAVMVLLFREVGLSGVLGVIVVFTVVPLQGYTGKLSARFRLQTAIRTDERVRLMSEIIAGVQVIKMYTWEKPFAALVALARRLELKIVKKNSYVRAMFMSFMLFTTRAATYCTMATMVMYNENLSAAKVFVFAQYFSMLGITMSAMFVRAIAETSEAWVSARRLEEFLLQDEFVDSEDKIQDKEKRELAVHENGNVHGGSERKSRSAVKMSKATAKWLDTDEEPTLDGVSIDIVKGKLVGIIGPVGSGKSSILQAILGELPINSGTLEVNGRVSYSSQEPWLFGSTIRQNILFGLPYDQFRYNEVVRVCSLQKDFQQFSHGDQTLAGDKGTSLSGGQKARINLARAVYREADIYLLDDPLSAVDAHVGRHLFDACIRTHLRRCTRVLVTHQLHYLADADHIIIMNNGRIEMQGSYRDIATSSLEYARLLIPAPLDSKSDSERESDIEKSSRRAYKRLGSRRASVTSRGSVRSGNVSMSSSYVDLADMSVDDAADGEMPQVLAQEASSKGAVKGSVEKQYLLAGANWFTALVIIVLFLSAQALASYFDWFVSFWTAQEERRGYLRALNRTTVTNSVSIFKKTDDIYSPQGLVAVGGITVALILLVALVRAILYYNACTKASQKLHDLMFRGIIRSPMKFFDDTPSGRIMNRFSKDMGAVDELLPKALMDSAQQFLTMCGAITLGAIVNPSVLGALAVIALLFWLIRKMYLVASKNIKRLEGITRSPVFSHLGSTLSGLTTIRVSGAQQILKHEFDKLQDTHTSAYYMFIATSMGFGFMLDMIFLLFIAFIIFSFFFISTNVLGDKVGLAITQATSLTFLVQYAMRQSAEVANQMTAVERLLEYTQLKPEKNIKPDKMDEREAAKSGQKLVALAEPPRLWPEFGRVQFQHVSMKYGPDEEDGYVLMDLNFVIEPKEKVGIVGRTGAGKSSIIQAMFRLAFVEGDITIDGVNTANISLEDLRKQLSIIPQDPMLFSGTLRRNLDPFEEYRDDLLWAALDQVELREHAFGPAGLEMRVMDGGANFSVGQRQLICLARALLRNNRVLMMDEATANVDPHTDNLIQQTIRTKFTDCTVLTIAHRLNTIADSDKVLVMDYGRLVEFGHPYLLMQKRGENPEEDGHFRKMVLETGADNFSKLEEIARDAYERTRKTEE